jgi:4-hydroxybenzoate polyprenyltransferase
MVRFFSRISNFGSRIFPMSRLRVFAQLVRLPNVFTAFADIFLGILATRQLMPEALGNAWMWSAFCLLAASGCLYSGGMVWNDVFDIEQDMGERPSRPIPSGRVSRWTAAALGASLLAGGIFWAWLAGWRGEGWHRASLYIALILAIVILLYDGWLKRFWAGPLGMGSCRFLNVLLGLSLAPNLAWPLGFHLALVVGIYVTGITWFARTEAQISKRTSLTGAAGLMAAGLVLALPAPVVAAEFHLSPSISFLFPYMLVALAILVGVPISKAISRPTATHVQAAVKRSIFGLVILDAALATALSGVAGIGILLLLVPAVFLGRWIYST